MEIASSQYADRLELVRHWVEKLIYISGKTINLFMEYRFESGMGDDIMISFRLYLKEPSGHVLVSHTDLMLEEDISFEELPTQVTLRMAIMCKHFRSVTSIEEMTQSYPELDLPIGEEVVIEAENLDWEENIDL